MKLFWVVPTGVLRRREFVLLIALLAAGVAGGCQHAGQHVYDERYRIFYSRDLGMNLRATDSQEEIASKFAPVAAVNAAIDQLSREGFTLAEVKPLPTETGAVMMTFRRPIPGGYRPTRAPMEFTGLYQSGSDPASVSYYVFVPKLTGYTIHVMGREGYKTYEADWDGRQLHWQTGDSLNVVALAENGQAIEWSVDSTAGGAHRVLQARRVRSLN